MFLIFFFYGLGCLTLVNVISFSRIYKKKKRKKKRKKKEKKKGNLLKTQSHNKKINKNKNKVVIT
jgi:hypothetical protein